MHYFVNGRSEEWKASSIFSSPRRTTILLSLCTRIALLPPPQEQKWRRAVWTVADSLRAPVSPCCIYTRPSATSSIRELCLYSGILGFLTNRLCIEPPESILHLHLSWVSVSAFYAARAYLICPQTGETQQLLLLIVCMSTCILLPCGGYCNRVFAAGGFPPSFCLPSCSSGPSVILVSFIPPTTSHTLRFIWVLLLVIAVAFLSRNVAQIDLSDTRQAQDLHATDWPIRTSSVPKLGVIPVIPTTFFYLVELCRPSLTGQLLKTLNRRKTYVLD